MRKDIFIVGARLLGIWQLLGAVVSLVWIIAAWLGYLRASSSQEYNSVHFIVQLATGSYLIFRTHQLFHLMERLKADEEKVHAVKKDVDKAE
jgi:hypothetical protein